MDRLAELQQLLEQVRAAIDDARVPKVNGSTQAAAVASLSREARALMAEIEDLALPAKESKADELAAARARRLAGAADPASTQRRGEPRRSNGSHRTG